jgi:hypothetical protein
MTIYDVLFFLLSPAWGRGWVREFHTIFDAPSPNLSPWRGEEHAVTVTSY